jgi:hypothetical protein
LSGILLSYRIVNRRHQKASALDCAPFHLFARYWITATKSQPASDLKSDYSSSNYLQRARSYQLLSYCTILTRAARLIKGPILSSVVSRSDVILSSTAPRSLHFRQDLVFLGRLDKLLGIAVALCHIDFDCVDQFRGAAEHASALANLHEHARRCTSWVQWGQRTAGKRRRRG